MELFLFIALVIFVLAVAKWNQGKDKPIEFDTPELKARLEKFRKDVFWFTEEVKENIRKKSKDVGGSSF